MQFFIQFMDIEKKNKNNKFKTLILGCKDFLEKERIFFKKLTFGCRKVKRNGVPNLIQFPR
jgi:hypothetical protein